MWCETPSAVPELDNSMEYIAEIFEEEKEKLRKYLTVMLKNSKNIFWKIGEGKKKIDFNSDSERIFDEWNYVSSRAHPYDNEEWKKNMKAIIRGYSEEDLCIALRDALLELDSFDLNFEYKWLNTAEVYKGINWNIIIGINYYKVKGMGKIELSSLARHELFHKINLDKDLLNHFLLHNMTDEDELYSSLELYFDDGTYSSWEALKWEWWLRSRKKIFKTAKSLLASHERITRIHVLKRYIDDNCNDLNLEEFRAFCLEVIKDEDWKKYPHQIWQIIFAYKGQEENLYKLITGLLIVQKELDEDNFNLIHIW